MGQRKNSGRRPAFTHTRRGVSMGVRTSSSGSPPHPLSHSSPIRQSLNRHPHRTSWGNGESNYYISDDRPLPCSPNEGYTWDGNSNKSPNSLSFSSDGSRSTSSDCGTTNSTSIVGSKYNICSLKKGGAKPSNPLRYKTELCRSFEENGSCRFGTSCTFAHGLRELRAVLRHPRYKTEMCRTYHGSGCCQYGARCHFIHDMEEANGLSSFMRGYKWCSQANGINKTLAMSGNRDVESCLNVNDVILANLRRIHDYKVAEAKFMILNSFSNGSDQFNSIGKLPTNYPPLNMVTVDPDTVSGLGSGSQPYRVSGLGSGSQPYRVSGFGSGPQPYRVSGLESGSQPYRVSGLESGLQSYRISGLESGSQPYRVSGLGSGSQSYRVFDLKSGSQTYRASGSGFGSQPGRVSGLESRSRSHGDHFGKSDSSESVAVSLAGVKATDSGGCKVVKSEVSHDSNSWDTDPELVTQYSFSLDTLDSTPRADSWGLGLSTETKAVIENPMEVSRSLLIPSITELIHKS